MTASVMRRRACIDSAHREPESGSLASYFEYDVVYMERMHFLTVERSAKIWLIHTFYLKLSFNKTK